MNAARFVSLVRVALIAHFPMPAIAGDGRIEINQASIEAGGGFPYTISVPGSYVLTSSLEVSGADNGLVLEANEISLDLNGFSITGPAVCTDGDCVPGAPSGITLQTVGVDGNSVTVRNGIVRGFAGNCIRLGAQARVSDVTVNNCGLAGIFVGVRSVVTRSTIWSTGQQGLFLSTGVVYGHNHVSEVGLGAGDFDAVFLGVASAGNYCDDNSCGTPETRKKFYLTHDGVLGGDALGACAPGFHMASLWEIFDPSGLRYDSRLGHTEADSGSGPPFRSGWVRTGYGDETIIAPGLSNCTSWTSSTEGEYGTIVNLETNWFPDSADAYATNPWRGLSTECSSTFRVWCIED